jgi:ketol-acid reductoisomerase
MSEKKDYYDKDCHLEVIQDENIAIIGYGSQAHAHALNLKDSGVKNIKIGLLPNSKSRAKAEADGFEVISNKEAAKWADILMLLAPDECQAEIYKNDLVDNLKQGATLAFAHGLNIHFKLIKLREDLDIIMIAPKGPGHTVRSEYHKKNGGVPCLVAVAQDKSKIALHKALAYASAIGGGKSGIIETNFREECETDLFGEQAVICGGVTALIKAGFEVLVEAGYDPRMAYFECLHEMKLIVDLMNEGGIVNMRHSISNTAEYGDFTSGPKVIDNATKDRMKKILERIQSGEFVKEYMSDAQSGFPKLNKMREDGKKHQIEAVGKDLRSMMPWIEANKIVKDS